MQKGVGLLLLLAALGAGAQAPDVQPLFDQGAAAIEAAQYAQARDLFAQIASIGGIDPGLRALAKLRVIDTFVLEKRCQEAMTACDELARLEDVPPHHKWEAAQRLERLKRVQGGLPPRDPAASRIKIDPGPEPAAVFFIGPAGADSAEGTLEAPFATFARALDAVRKLKQAAPDGQMPSGGARIRFLPGVYRVRETLNVPTDVSGRPGAPLVIEGKGARISGGMRVEGFKPVEDAAILERLPQEARGKVLEADLKAQGLNAFPAMAARGFAKAPAPFLEVYVNGLPTKPSRWPNEGFVKTGRVIEAGLPDSGKQAAFEYAEDRAARWADANDLYLYGYWFWDWADNSARVAAIDTAARTFTLADQTTYGVKEGQWYCAINLLEEIDLPAEWYLDRETGRLYLYPPDGLEHAPVEVSVLTEPLLRIAGASHVRVEGLTFELGAWKGIEIDGGGNCLVAGCVIRRMAGAGVTITGSRDSGVLSCDIHTVGRAGIELAGGDRKTLEPGNLFVENCHIYDYSRVDHTYTPAVVLDGAGNRVAHNKFHDSPCQGLRVGGNDHVIELNEVYSVVRETDDQGAVDMWGDPSLRGNVFRYNYWHDIGNGRPCGQAGIRLDDAISGTVVYGNVFERCSESQFGAIQIHGGKDNWVDNNVIADCRYGISFSQWGKKRWEEFLAGDRVQKLLYQDVDITQPPHSAKYADLARLNEGNDVNRIWRNLAVNCGGFLTRDNGIETLANNLVVPKGAAEAERGWRAMLESGAPAAKIGFDPIPFDEIGLYDDAYRAGGAVTAVGDDLPERIGWHKAQYDAHGKLIPWTSWQDALDREMKWYLNCPLDPHGYPIFVFTTFMDELYQPYKPEVIPATQDGMGIISYLKYWDWSGESNPRVLEWARKMGDYIVEQTLTPNEGAYPSFTRSTGFNTDFPLTRSSQGDAAHGPNVIEPDKGGIAGYALALLYRETNDKKYLDQAVRNADVLAANMIAGDAMHSPWPFRVDSVTGQAWGERSGNMVFILRLFDELLARGMDQYRQPHEKLWQWIKTYQFNAPEERASCLWIQFFEDMTEQDNRNSWAPLEMARYLIEKKESLDPDWKQHAEKCIDFAIRNFGDPRPGGVMLMGEQDSDRRAWGGACSKLGGVAAMFYAAGGGDRYRELALRNLTWVAYFIREDGVPCDQTGEPRVREGGWQEDCHTDVVHNFVDALRTGAF